MNLNTVVLPNLILSDLMITQAMASYTGEVVYLDYCAGTNKGGVNQKDQFNGVFSIGEMTPDRMNYTSQNVVEAFDGKSSGTVVSEYTVAWEPMLNEQVVDSIGTKKVTTQVNVVNGNETTPLVYTTDFTVDTAAKKITLTEAGKAKVTGDAPKVRIAYIYNNEYIPANDIPTLSVEFRHIPLRAKTRRIAVFYSNLAAFQAKNDYGFDMAADLATQAVAELSYEIDTEGVKLLEDYAENDPTLVWSRTPGVGVNKLLLVA